MPGQARMAGASEGNKAAPLCSAGDGLVRRLCIHPATQHCVVGFFWLLVVIIIIIITVEALCRVSVGPPPPA